MDQYEMIRTCYRVYGKSISEIARQTGHSRNTIKKAIRGEPWGYSTRDHQPFPVLDKYLPFITEWLVSDQDRPKNQRHTARRIYNRLVEEQGYSGGESTVRRYVRFARMDLGLAASCAFIPGDPEAGFEAEVDWGTATVILAGESIRVKFFCMRSKYSGKHFVRCYPCERQQVFFDAHIHAFSFFGGVFPVLIYDNLTTAIYQVLCGRHRIEQESFSKFRAYHNFESRFCNLASGNEKGGVEGLIGFARRNYMVPIPEAASLEELNAKILARCVSYGSHKIDGRDRTVHALYEEEKSRLLALPESIFSNIRTSVGRVDKYATVRVDKNRYSVPSRYAGFCVKTIWHANRVEIYAGSKRIASHARSYGNNKWILDPDHYLDLIKERPMAFNSARPIRQWRASWPEALNTLLSRFCQAQGETKGIKDFINVLMLYREYSSQAIERAVLQAVEKHISGSEGVRHLLVYAANTRPVIAPLESWPTLSPPDITVYGQLGGVQ